MLDYIRSLLSSIFAITAMYYLLDCEIKSKKGRVLMGFYITSVLLIDSFILFEFGYTAFMKLYPLIVHLPAFSGFVAISKFKPMKVFFVHWTLVAVTTSLSLVGLIVAYFFDSNKDVLNITCYILYIPVWFILYKYLREPLLYMMRNINKGWFGFSIIPIAYSMILYSYGQYSLANIDIGSLIRNATLVLTLIVSAYYMIILFFKQTKEKLTLQNEQELLRTQVLAAKHHYEALVDSQEKTKLYRHDMRHHLNLINAYILDQNQPAALNYIANVQKNIDAISFEKYCHNYTLNIILSSYIAKAKNKGIKVETQISLPEHTEVSDMDLCVIFANALENAINACSTLNNPQDRILKISSTLKNQKILIQITNSYDGQVLFVDNLPVSTEADHGLGTKSITSVAHKYGGLCHFTVNDHIFEARIIL